MHRKKFRVLTQYNHQFSAQATYRRQCRWNQIALGRPGKAVECLDCPVCPEGLGLVPQCGSVAGINATVECVQCKLGETYSDKHDLSSCKPCTICDLNEEKISPCTETKNAVCGKCKAGYVQCISILTNRHVINLGHLPSGITSPRGTLGKGSENAWPHTLQYILISWETRTSSRLISTVTHDMTDSLFGMLTVRQYSYSHV